MTSNEFYDQLRTLLSERQPDEADEMIRFLQDLAIDSGDEEGYLNSLGTPGEVFEMFMNDEELAQSKPVNLPPLPDQKAGVEDLLESIENALSHLEPTPSAQTAGGASEGVYIPGSSSACDDVPDQMHEHPEDEQETFADSEPADGGYIDEEKTSLEAPRQIHIELINGEVRISRADAFAVQFYQGESEVNVQMHAGSLRIESKRTGWMMGKKKVVVDLLVPESVLENLHAEVVNGTIEIHSQISRRAYVSTVNGRMELNCCYLDTLHTETVNGRIELNTIKAKKLESSSVNGKFSTQDCFFDRGHHETVNGKITLGLRNQMEIQAEIMNGRIFAEAYPAQCLHRKPFGQGSTFDYRPDPCSGSMKVNVLSGKIVIEPPMQKA